ncbi:MAG: hypothetical protein NT169_07060 [Chloroflexi bacterium]|nr:hypothetical protein [Chloroflexota bacterium]
MKTFYSLEDIEKLAAQGVRELVVDEDAVLTDLARDAAAQLGVGLVAKASAAATPTRSAPPPAVIPGSGAKPRGCQHGPLTGPAPAPSVARTSGTAGGLVDDLVGAVRQLANKGSAG